MYGGSVEQAAILLEPKRGPFHTLAARSGFSERECALAARTGRLAGVVACAEVRQRTDGMEARRQLERRRVVA